MEDNSVLVNKPKNLPKWLITVTPLSKYIAMVLFITLPFTGFILGMKYQKAISLSVPSDSKTINLPAGKISTNTSPLPTPINCGEIPSDVQIQRDHYTIVRRPMWSPDCKNIAWSSWQSTFANPSIPVGLFVYDSTTQETKLVYVPKQGQDEEDIEMQKWQDKNSIIFTKNGQKVLYIIDLDTGKDIPFEGTI